jgi:hypothetical protein
VPDASKQGIESPYTNFINQLYFTYPMATPKTASPKPAKPKEEIKSMRYRCEVCGKRSDKQEKCCGYQMVDLMSDSCMACRGCGFH